MAKNKQYIRPKGQQAGYRGNPNADNQNQENDGDDTLVDIVEVKEQAQDFFEKNQNLIIGGLAVLLLLIGGYLAYKYAYIAPREKAGMESMYKAEFQFKQDSFALALTNPGEGMEGFLDIIDNYSGTKASNLANYYAGISYLNLGQFEAAIDYLNDYSANDDITPITKNGSMGDAHAELGNLDQALSFYKKAANSDNEFLTPYYLNKLGVLNMKQGNNAEALNNYQRIADDYPQSAEARDAKKYIPMLKSTS
ncbi:MAG: tetratricopeptide repeat protein [Saprospiraceae bacterium]|nr:tetratricopeptide repeat protein [Saprospiraceae bacterium]